MRALVLFDCVKRYAHTTKVSFSLVLFGIFGLLSQVEKPSKLLLKGSSTTSHRQQLHHFICIRKSAISSGFGSLATIFPQNSKFSSLLKAHHFGYSDVKSSVVPQKYRRHDNHLFSTMGCTPFNE